LAFDNPYIHPFLNCFICLFYHVSDNFYFTFILSLVVTCGILLPYTGETLSFEGLKEKFIIKVNKDDGYYYFTGIIPKSGF